MHSRTQFPKPIWLSKGLHGPVVEVDTAERAAELLESWPNGRGKWYIAASRACRAASSGKASPVMAREMFVQAALEAQLPMAQ